MQLRTILMSSAFLSIVFASPTFAQNSNEIDGLKLYQKHCVKCHGAEGKANTFRGWLSRAQKFTEPNWQESISDEEILKAIQDGPKAMPSYKKKLTLEEQQAISQVVREL